MNWINSIFSDGSKSFLSKVNPSIGDSISIRLRIKEDAPIRRVFLRYLRYGEETILRMNKISPWPSYKE